MEKDSCVQSSAQRLLLLEQKMRFAGILSQWTKMQVVQSIIKPSVGNQIKDLLRISEPTATGENTCYLDVKKTVSGAVWAKGR